MSSDLALERAAWCLALDRDTAASRAVEVAPDVICVGSPVRGAGSVLVDDAGSTLFFPSSKTVEEALTAFRSGRRTPLEKFEDFRKDVGRDDSTSRPQLSDADRAVIRDWSSLPLTPGTVYRGHSSTGATPDAGTWFMTRSVVRATRDPQVAAAGQDVLYCILGDDGRSLDGHESVDAETQGLVAFRPGSRFCLVRSASVAGITAHLVLEKGLLSKVTPVAPDDVVQRFEQELADLLDGHRPDAGGEVGLRLGVVGDLS